MDLNISVSPKKFKSIHAWSGYEFIAIRLDDGTIEVQVLSSQAANQQAMRLDAIEAAAFVKWITQGA